jgi:predicted permease
MLEIEGIPGGPDWNRYVRDHLPHLAIDPEREMEIVEELAEHLDAVYQDALAKGASEEEAHKRAAALFADWRLLECELVRGERSSLEIWLDRRSASEPGMEVRHRGGFSMGSLLQDLRYGLRTLLKNPGFTTAALLSLALGIGANTAVFSVINALMLKILPVNEPRQLVFFTIAGAQGTSENFPYQFYEQFRDRSQACSGVIASGGASKMKMSAAEPGASGATESVLGEIVSGNFFSVLGVNAVIGRTLTADNDKESDPQAAAVISHRLWERRFGLDPRVVGRKVTLNDVPFIIVGVAPPGFFGFVNDRKPDLWWPMWMQPQVEPGVKDLKGLSSWWLRIMARRRPGVSMEKARAEMDAIFQQLLADHAASRAAKWTPTVRRDFLERRIELQSGSAGWTWLNKRFAQPLGILMAVVGLVLLIACANIANLLLARAATRQREIAVRLAIGAGRLRLIRQLLTESALLALAGGALGLLFANWGARTLLAYLPYQASAAFDVSPDARILGFTMAVSLLTGILFGLAPALRATRIDLTSALKDQSGGIRTGRSRLKLNKILVVTQVALSLFLLVGAGLFVRTLQNLKGLDAGFDRENVVLFNIEPGKEYDRAQRISLYRQLSERLEALPGAHSAGLSSWELLGGNSYTQSVTVEGYTPQPDEDMFCHVLNVGPKFFSAMGIPLLAGRDFGSQDERLIEEGGTTQSGARVKPRVTLINQAMAQYFFPNQNPIGKRFYLGSKGATSVEIIGLVKDAKYETLREKTPRILYLPYFQQSGVGSMTFAVRTDGTQAGFPAAIQNVVREIDPKLQALNLRTMSDVVNTSLAQERFLAQLAGFFSLLALLLASIGLYGVMSYDAARRTHEMGIRMALGARAPDLIRMVMRESMLLVVIGAIIGLGAALATTRFVSSLLYGLEPNDSATIALAALVMIAVAAVAGYLPARKASRVDPISALRCD